MTIPPPYVIGLDIGGTNMVAGVIASQDAQIISRASVPTDSARGPADGLRRISQLVANVIQESGVPHEQIGGIGIGCTGPIDPVKGLVQNPYTLPTWDDLPVVAHLSSDFKLPVCLIGDCQVAVLGEHWAGAGRGAKHVLYVTVGTGIGGGLIINGRLHRGVGFVAGEIGHHVIDFNGPDCYCGAKGCWEMLAAGPAIARRAAENAPDDSLLLSLVGQDRTKITARLVAEAAELGDKFATEMQQQTAFYLGVGLANLLNIIAPEVAILGGGVFGSWPLFEPIIMETLRGRAALIPLERIRVVPASLGLNAGITGAACAVLAYLDGTLD